MHILLLLQLSGLLAVANGSPVLAKHMFGNRLAYPVDFNLTLPDRHPLFGSSKTIRGVLASLLVTPASALLFGLDAWIGFVVAATAMAGDLCSSFVKRRIGLPPSSRVTGLDQIPESLFPLLACRSGLSLTALDLTLGVLLFFVAEITLSRVLFRLRVRDRPY